MKQLTVRQILKLVYDLKKEMDISEILNLPVYIGNDDELNGIHTAWYAQTLDMSNENDEGFIELINEDACNIKFCGKAIMIS